MFVTIERVTVGADRRTSIVKHAVRVEADRNSIRIFGELPFENKLLKFDRTFVIGSLVNGRGDGRDTWNGHLIKVGKNKVTLEGDNDRNQHIDFKDFVELNFRG
jgi:hypothetical protein